MTDSSASTGAPSKAASADHGPGPASDSPRWMQICGAVVFAAVVLLLIFLLPPLFRDADGPGAPGGSGVQGPPTSQQGPAPAGGHTTPAGGHAPPGGAP